MDDNILRKVRGLLAKAEDPAATPAEAEAFSAKAEALIGKYAIDRAILEHVEQDKGKVTLRVYDYPTPYGKPKASLLAGIAMTHSGKAIRSGDKLMVYGFASDLEVIDLLYTSLLLQGTNAMLHSSHSDRSFRTSFWYGFAGRVYERLEATKRANVEESGTGTAIVLRDRASEVESYFKEQHPRTRSGSRGRATSHAGFTSGVNAANSASIGTTSLSGSRAAIN